MATIEADFVEEVALEEPFLEIGVLLPVLVDVVITVGFLAEEMVDFEVANLVGADEEGLLCIIVLYLQQILQYNKSPNKSTT